MGKENGVARLLDAAVVFLTWSALVLVTDLLLCVAVGWFGRPRLRLLSVPAILAVGLAASAVAAVFMAAASKWAAPRGSTRTAVQLGALLAGFLAFVLVRPEAAFGPALRA